MGLASEEEYDIIEETNEYIVLNTDEDPSECFKFDKKTGKCLNDNNSFGAKRQLKILS